MQPLMFDERTWLAWLVKVRILILTLLLGIELAVARLTPSAIPIGLLVFTILFWYGISLFYVLLLSVWQEYRIQAALQVVTDVILVTVIVHVTGGVDSSLNFLYPLVIIVACILLPRSWAYATAALSFVLFGAIVELELLRLDSLVLDHPSAHSGAAGHCCDESSGISGRGISCGPFDR